MKCIAFIGYMCAGKTTIGRSLARSLKCNFYDLGQFVEVLYLGHGDDGEAAQV